MSACVTSSYHTQGDTQDTTAPSSQSIVCSLQYSTCPYWERLLLTAIRHGAFVCDHGGIVHCPVHKDDACIFGLEQRLRTRVSKQCLGMLNMLSTACACGKAQNIQLTTQRHPQRHHACA